MKRYYLSRIYEDPIEGWVPAFHPYRGPEDAPNLVDGGWTKVSLGVKFGQIGFLSAILPDLQANPDMILFDDWPLGVAWSSVPTNRRNQIRDQVNAMGLSFQHQTGFSVKQVLDLIVVQIQPGRTVEQLNVQDLASLNPNPG